MAYAFNNDKSKFSLDGKILNWVKIASYNENITGMSNTSTSTATKYNLCNGSWESMCTNWKNYDIIRVRFEISSFQFTIQNAKSVAAEVELCFENLTPGVLDAIVSPAASVTTFSISNKEYFSYFRRERYSLDSEGHESVAFYARNNLALSPVSFQPYLNALYMKNGSYTGRTIIEGASLYTL